MKGWALDLGTTNSGLACWNESADQPQLVELPEICRLPEGDDPLEAPRMVPSAVHFLESPGVVDRLGTWGPVARHFLLGRTAHIGRQAPERNRGMLHPAFAPGFKSALGMDAGRQLARLGRNPVSARMVAQAFLRELLFEVKRTTGHRVRELVVAAPISAFEAYRAEVHRILKTLGVRTIRFVDEPLAVALGYGLNLTRESLVLVVDIGGGTLHTEVVRFTPKGALGGQAQVLAKRARPLGGDAVDSWILQDICSRMGYPVEEWDDEEENRFWRRLMLAEACRVKEAVFFKESATFLLAPPALMSLTRLPQAQPAHISLTRVRLVELLESNGFYRGIEDCLDEMAAAGSYTPDEVEQVLLVGGSTLLPGVYPLLERRFERRRLRAWQPFEAVAYGAACFAAERLGTADFIFHDYAFVTHCPKSGEPQHNIIVSKGTRFPTAPDLWKRQVVPTCALGEPERLFKLVICEVARGDGEERRFIWDASGDLQKVGGASGKAEVIVPLNAASPTLGYLDPPQDPQDHRPRLEISFGVNTDRWLVATVMDLLTRRELMREEPVIRLV